MGGDIVYAERRRARKDASRRALTQRRSLLQGGAQPQWIGSSSTFKLQDQDGSRRLPAEEGSNPHQSGRIRIREFLVHVWVTPAWAHPARICHPQERQDELFHVRNRTLLPDNFRQPLSEPWRSTSMIVSRDLAADEQQTRFLRPIARRKPHHPHAAAQSVEPATGPSRCPHSLPHYRHERMARKCARDLLAQLPFRHR